MTTLRRTHTSVIDVISLSASVPGQYIEIRDAADFAMFEEMATTGEGCLVPLPLFFGFAQEILKNVNQMHTKTLCSAVKRIFTQSLMDGGSVLVIEV